jgi:ABC-type transport system involved in cytochrome c biogenesis permease component
MITIEIKKILKEGLLVFFLLIIVMMGVFSREKYNYLAPILEVFILMFASFTGWSTFERERQDGSMEYLLSLPVSRTKLFFIKLVPRLIAILPVLLLYHLTYEWFEFVFPLSAFTFSLLYISVFLLSLSLSLSMKNFLGTFFISLLLCTGSYFLTWVLNLHKKESIISLQAAISLIVIPIYFLLRFRKFDIKPISHFTLRLVPIIILVPVLTLGLTVTFPGETWKNCYLTQEGYSMTKVGNQTLVTDLKGEKTTYKDTIYPIFEDSGVLYAELLKGIVVKTRYLVRMDLESSTMEYVYQTPRGWWFHSFLRRGVKVGERIYLLLTNKNHKKYQILEVDGDKTRTIPVNYDFGKHSIHWICSASDNPLQFIVYAEARGSQSRVLRILESGQVEDLFEADNIAAWKDKLLVFKEQKMVLYQLGESLKVLSQREDKVIKIAPVFDRFIQKKVLIKINTIFYIYDLETEGIQKVNLKGIPFWYDSTENDTVQFVDVHGDQINYSTFKDGILTMEKEWISKIARKKLFYPYYSGVVVFNKKEFEIFRFLDN